MNQAEYENQIETVKNISVINREFIENEILLNRLDIKWFFFLKYINYVSYTNKYHINRNSIYDICSLTYDKEMSNKFRELYNKTDN
jgi:hypothetical protein